MERWQVSGAQEPPLCLACLGEIAAAAHSCRRVAAASISGPSVAQCAQGHTISREQALAMRRWCLSFPSLARQLLSRISYRREWVTLDEMTACNLTRDGGSVFLHGHTTSRLSYTASPQETAHDLAVLPKPWPWKEKKLSADKCPGTHTHRLAWRCVRGNLQTRRYGTRVTAGGRRAETIGLRRPAIHVLGNAGRLCVSHGPGERRFVHSVPQPLRDGRGIGAGADRFIERNTPPLLFGSHLVQSRVSIAANIAGDISRSTERLTRCLS